METELLAPAKNKETALAAINCGADAVYMGASEFGARKNAPNSIKDISDVVKYAHKFFAKVYITVNTILSDNELYSAVNLIKQLNNIGVDAIIFQDMGLIEKLMKLNLPLPLHASTQCDNRDKDKIKFFDSIGITRVVLARELSLEQIKEIHKEVPKIELEAFVHGALCVSYSGQCYLSQYIGGRSANRGECAQPCRKKYKLTDEQGTIYPLEYPLCLKDLNASACIKDMIDCGIYSFKIEGRLKNIEYVKNVVSFYRQELDKYSTKSSSGKSFYDFKPNIEKSFNRGYTNYFLKGRTNCHNPISPKSIGAYVGIGELKNKNSIFINTDLNISSQDGLCFINNRSLEGFLVNKVEKTKNGFIVFPNKKISIKPNTKIYRNLDIQFEKELAKPVKRQIGVDISIGNNLIKIKDENNIAIELELPTGEPAKNQEKMNQTFVKQFCKTGDSDFYINSIVLNCNIPFLSVSTINKIRRDAFSSLMLKRLDSYKRRIQKTIKHANYYRKILDYKANIHNKSAEEFYNKCGAKVSEYSLESKIPNRRIELMRTKHCIKYALGMCKSENKFFLQDDKGIKYPLEFDCTSCEMAVLTP